MSVSKESLSEYINTNDDFSPNRLRSTLSTNEYEYARKKFIEFFSDTSIDYITYGWTSGQLVAHILYRHDDGIVYILNYGYGTIRGAFYLTKSEMADYFEDYENEMPEFEESSIVREIIAQEN